MNDGHKSLNRLLAVIIVLVIFTASGMGLGYFFGMERLRREAVDNNAGKFAMVDQYGKVAFQWTTDKLLDKQVASR